MAGEAQVQFVGNVTADPRLNFLQSGIAVCNINVAVTGRTKQNDQWVDGDTIFYDVAGWREMGENMAESIQRGDRVTVTGRVTEIRPWTSDSGKSGVNVNVTADDVGLSLRFRAAKAAPKADRPQGQQQGQQQQPWGQQMQQQQQPAPQGQPAPQQQQSAPQQQDPWATGGQPQGGWGPPQDPPF